MNAVNVQLRQEIYRNDAYQIIDWLKDDEIVKYLNESQNVTDNIMQAINRVNLPVMTHLFNQTGSFFIINTQENESIGFLRLVPKHTLAEMVIVIGDKNKWGKGFGSGAVIKGLNHAFFEWRVDKVIAKINNENLRSLKVFQKIGFKFDKDLSVEKQYSLTLKDYLKLSN